MLALATFFTLLAHRAHLALFSTYSFDIDKMNFYILLKIEIFGPRLCQWKSEEHSPCQLVAKWVFLLLWLLHRYHDYGTIFAYEWLNWIKNLLNECAREGKFGFLLLLHGCRGFCVCGVLLPHSFSEWIYSIFFGVQWKHVNSLRYRIYYNMRPEAMMLFHFYFFFSVFANSWLFGSMLLETWKANPTHSKFASWSVCVCGTTKRTESSRKR